MQLNNIKKQVGLATCSLLQVTSTVANAADEWDVDTALLIYSESDGRVNAIEPGIFASTELEDDGKLSFRVIVDALTGATPNGAHASTVPQTFATPSGNSTYTVNPGETPLDDTFLDTRVAFGADWEMPLDRMSRIIWGANGSGEHDYFSLGLSATYLRDMNNRNTTLTAGLAFNSDTINPEGGIPTEFSPMRSAGINRVGEDDTKTITDFIIGVTQVVSRNTLVQLNFSTGSTSGYQNDPYKIVSVVDPATGLPTISGLSAVNADALPYVYEKRPDSRQRNSLFFRTVHHLDEDVINFSYRYFWDDWDIKSHTLDFKYRYEMDGGNYLQPHLRYYTQDAANFYTHNLVQGTDVDAGGNVLVEYASNDYRLAKSVTTTLGLKYGIPLGDNSELGFRAETITQSVDNAGIPTGEETPDLSAIVLQANYSFLW
jgi:hypothetical protein